MTAASVIAIGIQGSAAVFPDSLPLTAAPDSRLVSEGGGVKESPSDLDGQQMSPLGRERILGRSRTVSSTSPPAETSRPKICAFRDWRLVSRLIEARDRAWWWEQRMEVPLSKTRYPERWTRSCAYLRYVQGRWLQRARKYRVRWNRTLRDFEFGPGQNAWLRAVEEVQKVFPGTSSWLISCSAAEGGHGRWVGYGGVSYSVGLRDSNTVGGPLQYRYQTFRGMYRRALLSLGRYRIPEHLRDYDSAWRSALGQALAGGWGILHGQRSHWSASYGRGC